MKDLLQNLVKLQTIEFGEADGKNSKTVEELRAKIPAQILGHYDRLIARGKKGVAVIRNQVCSGCQMRLPIGVITTLMRNEDIQVCDNCGRYLYLPPAEPEAAPDKPVKAKPGRKPRKPKGQVAAG